MRTERYHLGRRDYLQLTTDEVFNEEMRIDLTLGCSCGRDIVTEIIYFTTIPDCPTNVKVIHGAHQRAFGVPSAVKLTADKLESRFRGVSRYRDCDASEIIERSILLATPVPPVF